MGGSQSTESTGERAAVVNRVENEQGEVTVEVCSTTSHHLARGWPVAVNFCNCSQAHFTLAWGTVGPRTFVISAIHVSNIFRLLKN